MKHRPELPPPVITVMTSRDAPGIFAVMTDAAHGRARQMPPGVTDVAALDVLMLDGVAFFMAYLDAEPIGAIGYRWERATLRIVHVAVKARHQRHGVARRLIQAVEAVGFALGTTSVSVVLQDAGLLRPFERLGYASETPERPGPGVTMRKALRLKAG